MLFANNDTSQFKSIVNPAIQVWLPRQTIQNHNVKLNIKLTAVLVVP